MQLLHGDCLELMKSIADKSIDMILADPPYGTTACKWDSVIPFEPMWKELKRIIKPNGAILLFGSEPFSSHLRMSNLKMFKYDWIIEKSKPTGHLNSKKRPMTGHDIISVFGGLKYYPQGLIKTNKTVKRTNKGCYGECSKDTKLELTGYPRTNIKAKYDSKPGHPTQKPVALLEYLIKTYTLENETVLDFTMGSGSTGVACVNLNRNFIGIEKDDNYFEIAKKRIQDAKV